MEINEVRGLKRRRVRLASVGLAAVLGLFLVLLYGYTGSFRVTVAHVTVTDPDFCRVLQGKTLAHLSDFHMDGAGDREQKVLSLLEKLQPDLLLLTGDYIAWKKDVGPVLDYLSKLKAPLGVFAVLGDYDYSVSRQSCLFCHEKATGKRTVAHRVRMLRNEAAALDTANGRLAIFGFDERDDEVDLETLIRAAVPESVPLLVLAHNPLKFKKLDGKTPVLMLAGDTHGGQIPLPASIWRFIGYEKNATYNSGVFREGRKTLSVSRGIGTSHLPFRLFCPPEIVVYHFSREGTDG